MKLTGIIDVRDGEGRVALVGFAGLLLLIIAGHTIIETARDALLLTGPGPRALGYMYMTIAACSLPAAAVAGRAGQRYGARRALAGTLAIAAAAATSMFLTPPSRASAVAIYVLSGVIGSVLVPQFWTLVGNVLTVAQGRRLFGLIGAAGIVGGVLGSGAAILTIAVLPVRTLLLASAAVFVAACAALSRLHAAEHSNPPEVKRPTVAASFRAVRDHPFLARIALVVALSAAALLSVDYLFKSSVTRSLPTLQIAPFVARYYLTLNLVSLFIQIFFGSAIVRRLGIATAIVLTPLLLCIGGAAVFVAGGAFVPVLLLKGIDGSLRYSVHRITGELVYLPIPSSVRARVKPLIDGALGRTSQALTGAGLIALGGTSLLSPRPFVALVTVLAAAWLIVAMSMRRPYLELLRHAISTGSLNPQVNPDPLDLESAELLVQHLASEDPLEIVGALNALSRRGREGLVSALVLLHTDEMVLTQALDMFGASSRTDWMKLARRLLADERETVRMAAARAFALRDGLDPDRLANDVGPRVRAYAAVHLALRDSEGDVVAHPRIVTLMAESGEDGDAVRLGMLAALADVPPTSRLSSLLLMLVDRAERLPGGTELVARAAARQGELRLIPRLVSFLSVRTGREAVRTALVALGEPALDEVWRTLGDPARDHSLRIHMPKTLARFGTKRAAEYLLSSIETEQDGFVRYKSIRALGVLVLERNASLERARIERISHAHLVRHFGILAVRSALGPPKPDQRRSAAERLLVGLLDDKLRQSLERAFQLLKIAHPREEIRRVHLACLSDDVYARANAGEFLDTLLRSRNQQPLRNLLRLIADDLPVSERVDRAAPFVPHRRPKGPEEALAALVEDRDPTVAALARLLVSTPGGATAPGVALSRNQRDPEVFDA